MCIIASEQEVHAPGPSHEEDASDAQRIDASREEPEDPEGAQKDEGLPTEEVRRQSLKR